VSYLLKAGTVKPEKQPLLANGSEKHSFLDNGHKTNNRTTPAARQQILNKQQLNSRNLTVTEERCFLFGPYLGVLRRTIETRMENCKGVCDENT
jgi:hypothetical protein